MVLVAGFLDLLLAAAVARRLGLANPRLAALLLAGCPLFLLLQTSFQSQVFALPAALAGYLAVLRARSEEGRRFGWGAAVGACSGWIFLTRPLTGLLFAAAMVPGLLAPGPERRAPGLRALSGAVLGGLPFLAVMLLYNRTLTGDPLQTPYAVYAAARSPWDVYPLFRSEAIHAPFTAFVQGLFRQLARWLPALFGILGAVGLGVWGLWRVRRRDGGAGLAFVVLLPLAYALHWYPGHWAYLGPVYGFEGLGLLIVAALAALEDAPEGWLRSLPPLALAAGVALFVYRFPFIQEQAEKRAAPQTAAAIRRAARGRRGASAAVPRPRAVRTIHEPLHAFAASLLRMASSTCGSWNGRRAPAPPSTPSAWPAGRSSASCPTRRVSVAASIPTIPEPRPGGQGVAAAR